MWPVLCFYNEEFISLSTNDIGESMSFYAIYMIGKMPLYNFHPLFSQLFGSFFFSKSSQFIRRQFASVKTCHRRLYLSRWRFECL